VQLPIWNRHPSYLENQLDSIRIFLDGYAYERQGRNPSYAHAAVDAIDSVISRQKSHDFPKSVWEKFSKLLLGKGLNKYVNPLFHTEAPCSCIWCNTKSENMILNAIEASRRSQIRGIWERIKNIRGIGPKIASFFLRDIFVQFELNLSQDRWLLQPVDIWVRRTVFKINSKEMNDEDVAKYLVENFDEPEKINQGIWYFSTQIAGSEYRLIKSIQDRDFAWRILREHIKGLKDAIMAIDDRKNI
jgi:hypothetical protein